MSLFLRTTALMLLVLSRVPAFAATVPLEPLPEENASRSQSQVSAKLFKHSLSGLYSIQTTHNPFVQPYRDFDLLYQNALHAQRELALLCQNIALITSTHTSVPGIKSRARALDKVNFELSGHAERITDLARATIIADDIPALVHAFETLSIEANVLQVKNRFKSPAKSGYRDLNVLVQLPKSGIIAEVQFHLRAIADVKSGPEHDLYERIQTLERQASSEQRPLTEWESNHIGVMRKQSLDLYEKAWRPYITTHTLAA